MSAGICEFTEQHVETIRLKTISNGIEHRIRRAGFYSRRRNRIITHTKTHQGRKALLNNNCPSSSWFNHCTIILGNVRFLMANPSLSAFCIRGGFGLWEFTREANDEGARILAQLSQCESALIRSAHERYVRSLGGLYEDWGVDAVGCSIASWQLIWLSLTRGNVSFALNLCPCYLLLVCVVRTFLAWKESQYLFGVKWNWQLPEDGFKQ